MLPTRLIILLQLGLHLPLILRFVPPEYVLQLPHPCSWNYGEPTILLGSLPSMIKSAKVYGVETDSREKKEERHMAL